MNYFKLKKIALIGLALSLASCAGPSVSYKVTRPAQLKVENIETVSVGNFKDFKGGSIALPKLPEGVKLENKTLLRPGIKSFRANSKAADVVRALIIAGISNSGQYKVLNTNPDYNFSGVLPSPETVGLINAQVKYFEFADHRSEKLPYLMLATKEGLPFEQMILVEGAKFGARKLAEGVKKENAKLGVFIQTTPYVEKISAMEVKFDFVRKNSGKNIVESQTLRSYYVNKWGGSSDSSHLPLALKNVIVDTYQNDQSLLKSAMAGADKVQLAISDPDEFLAQGGKLSNNPDVPATALDIKVRLANDIVQQYLKKISQYTEETTLEIAGGDAIAVNYLQGNAYDEAINRLESLTEKTDADTYNLALAYESVGEGEQAAKYYMKAINDAPENLAYRDSLSNLLKWVTDPNNVPAAQTYRDALELLKN